MKDPLTLATDFRRRLVEVLETLSARAMDSKDYKTAIEQYTTILTLNPTNRNDVLLNRSKAQALMHLWEEALKDADEVWIVLHLEADNPQ